MLRVCKDRVYPPALALPKDLMPLPAIICKTSLPINTGHSAQPLDTARRFSNRLPRVTLALLATLLAMLGSPALASKDYQVVLDYPWTAPQRVINFPANMTIGNLEIEQDCGRGLGTGSTRQVAARGTVVVPKDQFIVLKAGRELFNNPQLISKLPANAIDCLELRLMSMEDSEDTLCDRALAHIGNLKGLKVLLLDRSEVTDEGMKQIAALTGLEYLSADLAPVRGTFLKDLRGLKKLHGLVIAQNGIGEEEFKYLPDYPALQHLLVSRTNLTDRGMKYIGGCARLKRLDLSKNPGVGDHSIPYLKQLKQLRVLSIDDTSITPQGLLKLKGAGFTSLVLSQGKISRAQLAQIHSAFPKAHIGYRGGAKAVDEETGTLWGQMSRQRKF